MILSYLQRKCVGQIASLTILVLWMSDSVRLNIHCSALPIPKPTSTKTSLSHATYKANVSHPLERQSHYQEHQQEICNCIMKYSDCETIDESKIMINDMQKRRRFLANIILASAIPTTYPCNAVDFPFFFSSVSPLTLRAKVVTPLSSTTTIENKKIRLLTSPGAGTNFQSISYPTAFLGKWKLTSTFQEKVYPLGERFVPIRIRKRGSIRRYEDQPGDTISYFQEYNYDNNNNNNKIVSNREYNVRQQVNAQRGYDEVAGVKYDKNKQQLTIYLNTLGPDMQPLPPGRNEIFISNHAQEYSKTNAMNSKEGEGDNAMTEEKIINEKDMNGMLQSGSSYHFSTMEYYRTITLGVRSTAVLQTATFITYDVDPQKPNFINGKQRICVYLTPLPSGEEGDLYFEANNEPVGVYDFDIVMERIS